MTDACLFTADGDVVVATDHARGPWDPASCHGGPVAALLTRTAERWETGDVHWHMARLTLELTRPVPVGLPLAVTAFTERPGRKVSLVAVTLTAGDLEVARLRALRIRVADITLPDGLPDGLVPLLRTVDEAVVQQMQFPGVSDAVAFHSHGCEHRYTDGGVDVPGPVGVWIRLLVPVLAGEEPTGAQRAVAAADFGNGVSAALSFAEHLFINPDLTVHLARPPHGEWIGMRSESNYARTGSGLAESALFDADGRLGRSAQSLLLAER